MVWRTILQPEVGRTARSRKDIQVKKGILDEHLSSLSQRPPLESFIHGHECFSLYFVYANHVQTFTLWTKFLL